MRPRRGRPPAARWWRRSRRLRRPCAGRLTGCGRCSFFFQAEDGIRDVAVTGVQTCALPIFREAANDSPSPGGEGGDEGERFNQTFRALGLFASKSARTRRRLRQRRFVACEINPRYCRIVQDRLSKSEDAPGASPLSQVNAPAARFERQSRSAPVDLSSESVGFVFALRD